MRSCCFPAVCPHLRKRRIFPSALSWLGVVACPVKGSTLTQGAKAREGCPTGHSPRLNAFLQPKEQDTWKWSSKQTHCHRPCTARSWAATGRLGDAASSCSFSVGHTRRGLKTKGSWFPSSGFAGEDQVCVCAIKICALGAGNDLPLTSLHFLFT